MRNHERINTNQKTKVKINSKIAVWAIFFIGMILSAYIINTPFQKSPKNNIRLTIRADKNTRRVGYPIEFTWEISNNPSHAIIVWGDGSTFDITKESKLFGTINHTYDLQGIYNPTLQFYDVFGHQYSQSAKVIIQNEILQFNISCPDQIFEDEDVVIKVENLFEHNKELRKDIENFTYLYDFGIEQISSNQSEITYRWQNEGNYSLSVRIIDSQGTISRQTKSIEVKNKPPEAGFMIQGGFSHEMLSLIKISAQNCRDSESDENYLRYLWNWGDNTTSWGKYTTHSYSYTGEYPEVYNITLWVIDDNWDSSKYSEEIFISPSELGDSSVSSALSDISDPYVAIGTLPTTIYEDDLVQLISEIRVQEGNISDYKCEWSFGDGTTSFKKAPKHAWSRAGQYTITLLVYDKYGTTFVRERDITIKEKAPEIVGPFSFQGIESKANILDVEVYDAILDQPSLTFKWFDQDNQLVSTRKKPLVMLDDGDYQYTFEASDSSGFTTSCVIDITVQSVAPEIYVSNYVFHSPTAVNFDDIERLTLKAYMFESDFDLTGLYCGWYITKGREQTYKVDFYNGNFSQITFICRERAIYQGELQVSDRSGNTRSATFELYSYVEAPEEESTKQLEELLDIRLSAPKDSTDSDGDNLSDLYEIEVSGSSPFDFDTDKDGLYDGFDDRGIGEQTLGTSPIESDSDLDGLEDGFEYWGWDISIDYYGCTTTLHVNSDPLDINSDYDQFSDYDEFLSGTHPRLEDSDSDNLIDSRDPFPTTYDNDIDGLSDYMEKELGTNMSNSDTDGDSLKDGEEVLIFHTNPTRKDTDSDFLSDNAEFINYRVGLENEYGKEVRVNLTKPISLFFPKFFTRAAVAQIAFTISFGEYGSDDSQNYGITDDEVKPLNIAIRKPDENLELYNLITNTTRYFSQVVDITEVMNDENLAYNYHGTYTIEVKDINGKYVSDCLLEQFELFFSRPLDPNCEDFDGDGIMDGVEMGGLVRGTERIDISNFYNSTSEGIEFNYDDLNEFSLEISDIGRVYDASLTLEIKSNELLAGNGNLTISLIYNNLKTSVEDKNILSVFQVFSSGDNYFYKNTLDLSALITNNEILEYYGKYNLKIEIHSTNFNDTFYISNYYIDIDTYVQAELQDKQAWITEASLFDSDNDGWSDYYEIYTSNTCPLDKDSDGDQAWDSNDRDPLRNLMLEIEPVSATYIHQLWGSPDLEIGTTFYINDGIDPNFSEESSKIGFFTSSQTASTNPNGNGINQIAWWNRGKGDHYYFDINDDLTIQSNEILFDFQLWRMHFTGDEMVFEDRGIVYSIGDAGHWEELVAQTNGHNVRCRVTTIAIERVNTIAVFNPTDAMFNGHYKEKERMNVIQLHVTADGYFPASISFEQEHEESTPDEWDGDEIWYDESNVGQNPIVINEFDGHSKILQFHDTSLGKGRVVQDWNKTVRSGILELWVRISDLSRASIIIRDGTDQNSIFFRFDASGYFQYKHDSVFHNIDQYPINEWIHLKFKWDFWEDWHLWINGKSYDILVDITKRLTKGFEYQGMPNGMNSLVLETEGSTANYYFYVDSIGYSFDPYYIIGDNLIRHDTSGTPFKPGLNVIVVPTSLFSSTLLNSYIQNKQLEKTPLYTEREGLFEFYSVDRDGTIIDEQCGDTDSIFVRHDILPEDAMKVLQSLLNGAVNQSKDENNNAITTIAKLYDYASTKLDGIQAVSMNLPQGVLSFIPWISNFINSSFGRTPTDIDFWELWLIGQCLQNPMAFLFFTPAFFSGLFGNYVAQNGLSFFGFLGTLFWILIRAALIVFFFIVLAIEIITTVPLILAMGVGLSTFSWLLGMSVSFNINCLPLYAQDTRIGQVIMDIEGSEFILEAWVTWVYWDFFDLFIPAVDFNVLMDPNSPLVQPPEDPINGIGTFLTCGYDQMSEYVFNFHTIYWDTPYNTPPKFVIVTLLCPSGITYNYSMDVSPVGYKSIEYWTGKEDLRTGEPYCYNELERTFIPANWYRGVMFNATIDFETEFSPNERHGQWYYQFHTRAEREHAVEVVWPSEEYAVGPFFNESGNISEEPRFNGLQYTELTPSSGHSNQEFNFSVWWADHEHNTLPADVYLVLELPNRTIQEFQMSAASSVDYDYSMVADYGWVTFTEYKNILNFSESMISEPTLLKYYYIAIHSGGQVETLFDTKYVDELGNSIDSEDEYDDMNATEVDTWFEGPLIFPYSDGKPLIKKWEVQDLTNNKFLKSFGHSNMIWEEQELVFWLYVYDPDRSSEYYRRPLCYSDNYPLITLTNKVDPTESLTFNSFTWSEYDYDLQADIFWVQIGADEIGAGLWSFEFALDDSQGNNYIIPKEKLPKLWIVGSVDNIFRKRKTAMNAFGFWPTTLYLVSAGLATYGNLHGQIAATIATLGIAITTTGFVINELCNLFTHKNTGGLIGLGLGLITIGAILSLSLGHYGNTEGSIGSIGFQFSNIGYFFMCVFSLIGGMIFAFTDLSSILYNLFFLFGDVFHFISLSMVLGMTINSITQIGGKNFKASSWIKSILKIYSIILILIGFICFIAAHIKNGGFSG